MLEGPKYSVPVFTLGKPDGRHHGYDLMRRQHGNFDRWDVYYLPPGHTIRVEKSVRAIEFNHEGKYNDLIDHLHKKMEEKGE